MYLQKIDFGIGFCGIYILLHRSGQSSAVTIPDFCFDFGIPSTVDNNTGSNVKCDSTTWRHQ